MSTDEALLSTASELTAHVTWGRKYRQCWLMIAINSYNAMLYLEEAGKTDITAYDLLNSIKDNATAKSEKLAKWLEGKEASLNKLMQEVDPDVATNR